MKTSASERYERAQAALMTEQETLGELKEKLHQKESEWEESVVAAETGAGQRARKDRLEKEVVNLRERKAESERTINILERALDGLEREAHLEEVAEEHVPAYTEARDRYVEALAGVPSTEELKSAIAKITAYTDALQEAQEAFHSRAQRLNAFLLEEGLDGLGGVTIEDLKRHQDAIDTESLSEMGYQLSELREELEAGEDILNEVMGSATIAIIPFPVPDQTELCGCGVHKRTCEAGREWRLFEIIDGEIDVDTGKRRKETIELARGTTKPEWPCYKSKPIPKQQHAGNLLGEPGLPIRAPGDDVISTEVSQ